MLRSYRASQGLTSPGLRRISEAIALFSKKIRSPSVEMREKSAKEFAKKVRSPRQTCCLADHPGDRIHRK
ncbi:hypothetical protein [Leptolyngbya sp. O-77]|uniref:hypothetical protein n=1 Tax=Leptolyngbya sp. O-77 TaxID=1080068 RepID=UPI000B21EF71|nr:hypothetical protein [Leptolyngbya sp. O-77]